MSFYTETKRKTNVHWLNVSSCFLSKSLILSTWFFINNKMIFFYKRVKEGSKCTWQTVQRGSNDRKYLVVRNEKSLSLLRLPLFLVCWQNWCKKTNVVLWTENNKIEVVSSPLIYQRPPLLLFSVGSNK